MKKQILSIFLAGCLFTSFAATEPATSIAVGNGSAETPYEISSVAELLFMRNMTNDADASSSYRSKHYVLTADIDMADEDDWTPICKAVNFSGIFDGKGHAVKNLKYGTAEAYSSAEGNYIGLFGQVKNGTISDLKIEDVAFYSMVASSTNGTGGIVASLNRGVVENCVVSGTLMTALPNDNTADIRPNIGGIAGRISTPNEADASVLIINSSTHADIGASTEGSGGRFYAGGIVGFIGGSNNTTVNTRIVNSYSSSNISVSAADFDTYAGGIAGELSSGTNKFITNCYVSGDVYAKGKGGNVSGLVGRSNNGTTGNVTATISNCIALNSSIKFERNSEPFRIAKNTIGVLSDNYALSTDFMVLQRVNSSGVWTDITPTSSATGEHGETLTGETKEEQIAAALSKLNAYVAANPTVEGMDLETWIIATGDEYPTFGTTSGAPTAIDNITAKTQAQIINVEGGFEVIANNLSNLEVFNTAGQKVMQITATNERAFVGNLPANGLIVLSGKDVNGNRLFAQKHMVR